MIKQDLGGFYNLDKPAGQTSHDIVDRVRRLTGVRRVGHAGTLDPMATGVLVVGLGPATRLMEYLVGLRKRYEAQITLGITTDTFDGEGQVTAQNPVPHLAVGEVEAALKRFRGPILQRPPAFSALKRNGVALYRRARQGETVEIEPREVTIYELTLRSLGPGQVELDIACSAGTYVRSIAHDLGQALGCGAHLSALRRTAVGHFAIDDAITLPALEAASSQQDWVGLLLPMDQGVAHLAQITLSQQETRRLVHGQTVQAQATPSPGPHRVHDETGRLVGIAEFDPERASWRPVKVLVQLTA